MIFTRRGRARGEKRRGVPGEQVVVGGARGLGQMGGVGGESGGWVKYKSRSLAAPAFGGCGVFGVEISFFFGLCAV